MREIVLPKLNTNDVTYTLLEWYGDDGDAVTEGAVVALVETSKTAEDILAPAGGVLQRVVGAKRECAHGDVIGYLFDSEAERLAFASTVTADAAEPELVITEPARLLMERTGIDPARVRGLGKAVIRRSDVEALIAAAPAGPRRYELPRQQRAVADVVTRSALSIPAAFTAMWIDTARVRRAKGVGVVELLVRAIGTLRERHPLCFGAYQDDGGVLVPEGAHVAVTVDAGNGLYLPVVRDVAALSLEQIAAALAAMREAARAGTLRAEDLAGANIGLSVTNYADVVLTQPIIPPGMTCMLSLAGTQRTDRFALGIAHDHRVVNGRDAVIVLRDVKRVLETGVT
ncbi:2-oxo acid dehydrogenase subunit E2 [Dactylosporangium darangshiense]|uniref:Dihydrolipoamide acetyltransferase component of pyruvate dehydrogenase complex n=1 Tax=Dactylosporangium darangshiense TaxID=579108 RepID=A0ABP8DSE2_9ACTN